MRLAGLTHFNIFCLMNFDHMYVLCIMKQDVLFCECKPYQLL